MPSDPLQELQTFVDPISDGLISQIVSRLSMMIPLQTHKKTSSSLLKATPQCSRFFSEGLALAPPTREPGRPSALPGIMPDEADGAVAVVGAAFVCVGDGAALAKPAARPPSLGVDGCSRTPACAAAGVTAPAIDALEAFLLWP